MREYLKVWEYNCDSLATALCSLYNFRVDNQENILNSVKLADRIKTEENILLAKVSTSFIKEKYDSSYIKLVEQIEKGVKKPQKSKIDISKVWEALSVSLITSNQLIEQSFDILFKETYLNQKVATSLMDFISERPLFDNEALKQIELYS